MQKRKVIGLMSGTSHDGVDAVLADIKRTRKTFAVDQRAFASYPYSRSFREKLLDLSQGASVGAAEVSRMNVLLGQHFARAVKKLCRMADVSLEEIDVIGSHGHTVYHRPKEQPGPGSTLQIGEPSVIANHTGITTVADFRPADVAVRGEGAPLVPFVHAALFQDTVRAIAIHNVGGIANLTYLPAKTSPLRVWAFDTGPGNVLIDGVVQKLTDGRLLFDRNGKIGKSGKIHRGFLAELLRNPYFGRRPPKSTGREEFGAAFIEAFLRRGSGLKMAVEDQVATATALTASTMAKAYEDQILPKGPLDDIFVSGGGARNKYLLNLFAELLPNISVQRLEETGFDSKALEALAFAILAYATLNGLPSNVPNATGAKECVVLGKISPGKNFRCAKLK